MCVEKVSRISSSATRSARPVGLAAHMDWMSAKIMLSMRSEEVADLSVGRCRAKILLSSMMMCFHNALPSAGRTQCIFCMEVGGKLKRESRCRTAGMICERLWILKAGQTEMGQSSIGVMRIVRTGTRFGSASQTGVR